MFNLKSQWGNHKIFSFDTKKHNFLEYFQNIFVENKLELLHLKSTDYNNIKDVIQMGNLNDRDTDLHKIFYNNIKKNDNFKKLYCNFIRDIYKCFFSQEDILIYQSYPSIRIQYMESRTIPPHKDSDKISNHPIGEKNFIIPITKMYNTNSIYIESESDKKDFKSINLDYGDLFFFNGNTCTHYNEKNKENKLRISLDFRIILKKDYINYIKKNDVLVTNPRDIFWNRPPKFMQIGGYYQLYYKEEPFENMLNWIFIKDLILQHRPTFEKEEAEATYKYMLEDNFITEYKKTSELENIICKYIGIKHCIMTTSGTIAIIIALMSLDLEEGSEIIVPNYTMIATINAVKFLKLKPVIIDVDKDMFTLNCKEIENNINKKTRVVLHVSINNRYTNMNHIKELCDKNNIILIEDSAQSLGCKVNNKSLGTFGKIGCFSLSTPKIISTGQGGFCITDDDMIAKKIRMIKNFGRGESGKDNFEVFGINAKFTDLQAVIGIEQMKKMDFRVMRIREIYNLYYNYLKDYIEIKPPLNEEWIPWFVDIYVDNRVEIMNYLKKHKIQTRPVYGEINKTDIYKSKDILSNSSYVCNKGLFLPSYITITNREIKYICDILYIFFNNEHF
jgi:perosamine synthetase